MGKISKAQSGITKSRKVERSPDGNYKMITKEKTTPRSESRSVKEVRTTKGMLKGVPKNSGTMERIRGNSRPPVKFNIPPVMKNGGKEMLTRADGTKSRRGLWDNIRAAAKRNKAAGRPGKKPTAAMLKQERRIKAKGK